MCVAVKLDFVHFWGRVLQYVDLDLLLNREGRLEKPLSRFENEYGSTDCENRPQKWTKSNCSYLSEKASIGILLPDARYKN